MPLPPFVRRQVSDPRLRRRWLLALLVLALTKLPLLGMLGYESALILSPVCALFGAAIGVDGVRRTRAAKGNPGRRATDRLVRFAALIRTTVADLGICLAIPVTILLMGRLWQRGCDPLGGVSFYLMGPVISGALGAVTGLCAGVLGQRRSAQLGLACVPFFACLGVGLWRLYADPVVFAFDPYWGYFSGSIYDEDVSVGTRYIRFRLYNGLWAAAALLLLYDWVRPKDLQLGDRPEMPPAKFRTGLAIFAIAWGLYLGLRADRQGWTATTESLARSLPATRETPHFVIHYAPRSNTAREIEAVAAEHEHAWQRLESILGRAPSGPVHSFVFDGPEQKRRKMGAGRVEVAAPWRRQIYLNYETFPHRVLHHELAHIFGATMGDDLLGISRRGLMVNLALVEGFATALAPRTRDGLDLHDQAAVLDALEKRPSLETIMGPRFWTQSSRRAYTAAGSFVAWLIDTHGVEPMAKLYRSAGDFQEAYGTGVEALETQWLAFLRDRSLDPADLDRQAQRFRRRPVFERPCAHKVAALGREISLASDKGALDEMVEGLESLCEMEPFRAGHKLSLAHGLARAGRLDEARTQIEEVRAMPDQTSSILSLADQREGDLEIHLGDLAAARDAYDAALARPTSEGSRRGVQLKRLAAENAQDAALISAYYGLFDETGNSLTRAITRLWVASQFRERPGRAALGDYLIARQLLNVERPGEAVPRLESALGLGDTADPSSLPSPEFVRAARLALLAAYVQVRRYDDAAALLKTLEQEDNTRSGYRLTHHQWRERIAAHRTLRPAP